MDLQKYEFKHVPTISSPTDKRLLAEARSKGFYEGNTEFNTMFNNLFFNGGNLTPKAGLPKEFVQRAVAYLTRLARSFAPKHEEKEAVCALILSEITESGTD